MRIHAVETDDLADVSADLPEALEEPDLRPLAHGGQDVAATHQRGVAWVLRQAAIAAVLFFTFVHVLGVICLASTEQRLVRIVQTAAEEATLPRSTSESTRLAAIRLLQRYEPAAIASVAVERDGRARRDINTLCPGDYLTLAIRLPCRHALPATLSRLAPWLANDDLVATTVARVPSNY